MTQVCVCDRCGVPASGGTFTLSGWWQLVTESKKRRTAQPIGDQLSADICHQCSSDMGIEFVLEPTRQEQFERWKKEHPGRSGLEGLRRTSPTGACIGDVTCDRCQANCSERYARLFSTWVTENQENLYADLCPSCFKAVEMPSMTLSSHTV